MKKAFNTHFVNLVFANDITADAVRWPEARK